MLEGVARRQADSRVKLPASYRAFWGGEYVCMPWWRGRGTGWRSEKG
jgi:hypothetical protein